MRFLKNRSLWAVATLTKAMALHWSDISLFISCILNYKDANRVLIFCVEFLELSHLTRDLSQAEKKITGVVKS